MPGKRCTQAQVIQRVDQVFIWMLDGIDSDEICQLAGEKWQVAQDTARHYIEKARKDLKRLSEATKMDHLKYTIGNLVDLVKKTRKQKNYNCTLGALSQFADITGLKKIVVEMPKDEMPDVNAHEAAKQLEAEELVH